MSGRIIIMTPLRCKKNIFFFPLFILFPFINFGRRLGKTKKCSDRILFSSGLLIGVKGMMLIIGFKVFERDAAAIYGESCGFV